MFERNVRLANRIKAHASAVNAMRFVRGHAHLLGSIAVLILLFLTQALTPLDRALSALRAQTLQHEASGSVVIGLRRELIFAFALILLMALWPKQAPIDLKRLFLRHAGVFAATLGIPFLLQALTPLSADFALVYAVQLMCILVALRREFQRRAQEVVRQREAHLAYVALHDPETALPNRRAMLEKIAAALAGVHAREEGVVLAAAIGIDRFVLLRSAIGYANANEVVAKLGENLRQCSGQAEIFHISTSILGLVVAASSETEARAFWANSAQQLNRHVQIGDQTVETHLRAGFSISNQAAPEKLLEEASLALDQARRHGRPWVHYKADEASDPKVQLALVSDVVPGLQRGEFILHYQPKVRLSDGAITGAEALIRWRHPIHGPISPDRFIEAAEETGTIHELTRWAIKAAISDQAMLAPEARPRFAVNVSGRCFSDPDFCAFVIDAVKSSGAALCLEITETALIEDPALAIASTTALRAAGIKIAIDDYGAGLSSLSYIKSLSADELKLDKSLLADVLHNERDRLIVKSTIDLAHGLGMTIVAEGVEDRETAAILAGMDCDLVQGYLVSKALALADFQRFQAEYAISGPAKLAS